MVYQKFTRVCVELVGCVLYVQKVKTKNGGGQVSKNISQEVVGKFWGDHQYKFTERNNETTIISHCWLDFKHGLFFVWIVVVCFCLTAKPETYSILLGHDGYFDYQVGDAGDECWWTMTIGGDACFSMIITTIIIMINNYYHDYYDHHQCNCHC